MSSAMEILSATLVLSSELLLRTVPIVIIGVLIAEILIALRITERIASVAYPVTTFSHLPRECGASFLLAFVSPQAADAMLVDYYHKGMIGRGELVVAALINSFPSVVMHWRYLIPVYVPLLGVFGVIYFAILMAIGFLKTGIVMIAGRMLLSAVPATRTPEEHSGRTLPPKTALRTSLRPAARTLRRILGIMIPTLVVVAFLIEAGVFDAVAAHLEGASRLFPIPPEGLAIIAAKFGSYIAAASLASGLLAAGDMVGRDIVVTLLVANLLTSVVTYLRWLGSFYVAIFGPKQGTEIMLLSVALQDGLLLVTIFLLAWFW
ncbi:MULTISPECIES: nucleoside recognition protein [unclassified Methanoculleus]|uniref:nucleoside recognition protein n=2 Tax=Methanoculleus TaxID=45989 RepID=UPI0025CF5C4F|nr:MULTISPECIES: nucleoside recognition protein [unclassified Methanoculleus]